MTTQPYPFTTTVEVAFRDIDAMGHVNNAVYLSYLESARIKFVLDLLELRGLGSLPLILAEATVTYKSPAFFGELLTIGMGVSRMGTKSFDLACRISAGDGRLVALARTVQVAFDYASQQTIPVPQALRDRIQALQGDWRPPE